MGNGTRVMSLGRGATSAIGARMVFASRAFVQVALASRAIAGGSEVVRIGRKGVPLTITPPLESSDSMLEPQKGWGEKGWS